MLTRACMRACVHTCVCVCVRPELSTGTAEFHDVEEVMGKDYRAVAVGRPW